MNDWKVIQSDADSKDLLDNYGGFHDTCLVELNYRSGAYVNRQNAMIFEPAECFCIQMIFNSQWHKKPLELCFHGVRKFHIAGFQDNYYCEILDCHLAFHSELIAGRNEKLIVWADVSGFSPTCYSEDRLLKEPMTSFVVASSLKWRFRDE